MGFAGSASSIRPIFTYPMCPDFPVSGRERHFCDRDDVPCADRGLAMLVLVAGDCDPRADGLAAMLTAVGYDVLGPVTHFAEVVRLAVQRRPSSRSLAVRPVRKPAASRSLESSIVCGKFPACSSAAMWICYDPKGMVRLVISTRHAPPRRSCWPWRARSASPAARCPRFRPDWNCSDRAFRRPFRLGRKEVS